MSSTQTKADLSVWQIESLRITCFPGSATEFNSGNWWQDVIGEQPENTLVRARDGFRQDEAILISEKLFLGFSPYELIG